MKSRAKVASKNWELDGDTATVFIPMTWKRRGGRKVIIAPDGGDAWAPARPRPDETLIRALARAHRWKRLLDKRQYRSGLRVAEAEGVHSMISSITHFTPRCWRQTLSGRTLRVSRQAETGSDAGRVGRTARKNARASNVLRFSGAKLG